MLEKRDNRIYNSFISHPRIKDKKYFYEYERYKDNKYPLNTFVYDELKNLKNNFYTKTRIKNMKIAK